MKSSDPDVRLLHALADPTRLAIVRQLATETEVCACDFTVCCDVSQPTVSHHLRVLREAGIVEGDRRGTWVHYRLRPEALRRVAALADSVQPRRVASWLASNESASLPVIQPSDADRPS